MSPDGGYYVTTDELITTEIELDVDLNGDGIIGAVPTSPVAESDPTSSVADDPAVDTVPTAIPAAPGL